MFDVVLGATFGSDLAHIDLLVQNLHLQKKYHPHVKSDFRCRIMKQIFFECFLITFLSVVQMESVRWEENNTLA